MTDTTTETVTGPLGGLSPADLAERVREAIERGVPVEIFKGPCGIFATPTGGLHIAYRSKHDAADTPDGHIEIPPQAIRLLMAQASGAGPFGTIKAMLGG